MAKKIHYSKEMRECPYCGSEEFYVKQSFTGTCRYNIRFDGEITENGEMYQYATHTDITKYAYCSDCEKRLFPMEEYYKSLF